MVVADDDNETYTGLVTLGGSLSSRVLDAVMDSRSQSLSRVFEELLHSRRSVAGVPITPETALECSAVLACVRVLSESIAAMPTNLYKRLPGGGKEIAEEHPLHEILAYQPNSWMTSFEFKELMMSWLLLWGNAYAHIKSSAARGAVGDLIPLHPSRMKIERLSNGKLRYNYTEPATDGDPNPEPTPYRQDEIFHLRWLSRDGVTGYVPVSLSREAIGLARATELHSAAYFGNGARAGTYIEVDQPQKPDALQRFRQQWDEAHRGPDKAYKTVVMPFGFKKKDDPINNESSQLIQTRLFQLQEIACRTYRVPPHMVGDLSNVRHSTVEQAAIDYKTFSLMPWCRRWELACRRDLVVDDKKYFVGFDMNSFMAGDYASRAEFLREAFNTGAIDVDEYRAEIGYNPLPDGLGKKRFVQVNMQLLDAFTLENPTGQAETPAPTVVDAQQAEEQPGDEAPAEESPPPADGQRSMDAAEALFRTSLRRIAAVEIDGVIERRAKPEKITTWLDQIDTRMRSELLDAANATGRDIDSFVGAWMKASRGLLLGQLRSGKPYEEVSERWFEAHFDEMEGESHG